MAIQTNSNQCKGGMHTKTHGTRGKYNTGKLGKLIDRSLKLHLGFSYVFLVHAFEYCSP